MKEKFINYYINYLKNKVRTAPVWAAIITAFFMDLYFFKNNNKTGFKGIYFCFYLAFLVIVTFLAVYLVYAYISWLKNKNNPNNSEESQT